MAKPKLSIVVIFYNMRREAKRTLFSLTADYQRDVDPDSYEVIAIDSGSTEPLSEQDVKAFGKNFRYTYFTSATPSPAPALNYGAKLAEGDVVMLLIDGARILSPGILHYTQSAFEAFRDPFVYTLGMHLGPEVQNKSMLKGYSQEVEDKLLETIAWRANGYQLFQISSLAASNKEGFFSRSSESNCVSLKRDSFLELGGYDERFVLPGGGIVNLDFFNRLQASSALEPVMLLGEASFHQFHGGVATNKPPAEHPWENYIAEYLRIKGEPYEMIWTPPSYLGHLPAECQNILAP